MTIPAELQSKIARLQAGMKPGQRFILDPDIFLPPPTPAWLRDATSKPLAVDGSSVWIERGSP